jgi:hypothetical protein
MYINILVPKIWALEMSPKGKKMTVSSEKD